MATKRKSKPALQAVESAMMRSMRIDGSHNGATLHTRVVRDKTKYSRNLKHKKSLAYAGDFPFITCGRVALKWPSVILHIPRSAI